MEALCKLAQSSPSFAEKCLDFLVDMFNDEIEEVRLQSIHVLRKISTHITLREDQLDTVLAVLEVCTNACPDLDIRFLLHFMLFLISFFNLSYLLPIIQVLFTHTFIKSPSISRTRLVTSEKLSMN